MTFRKSLAGLHTSLLFALLSSLFYVASMLQQLLVCVCEYVRRGNEKEKREGISGRLSLSLVLISALPLSTLPLFLSFSRLPRDIDVLSLECAGSIEIVLVPNAQGASSDLTCCSVYIYAAPGGAAST